MNAVGIRIGMKMLRRILSFFSSSHNLDTGDRVKCSPSLELLVKLFRVACRNLVDPNPR